MIFAVAWDSNELEAESCLCSNQECCPINYTAISENKEVNYFLEMLREKELWPGYELSP